MPSRPSGRGISRAGVAGLVAPAEIRAAAERIAHVAVRTPLLPYPPLRPGDGQDLTQLLVKPESLQPTGSFKVRGAYAAISALPAAQRRRGVIAHSSGNHAQAVAYAAAIAGVPAVVVVPETASAVKVDSARALGAQVVTVEPTMAARVSRTREIADERGYTVIPPFDDPGVIAGQGTIGLEIAADLSAKGRPVRPYAVLVPVSGGGLISGIATAIKDAHPQAAVIGVEPDLAADARDSLEAGEPVAWPASRVAQTIADGLRVERVGDLTFAHMRAYLDGIVTVTEDEIRAAIRRTARDLRLIAEPAGAVAVAAYLFRKPELPRRQTYVAVLSGGNIAPSMLAEVLAPAADGQQ